MPSVTLSDPVARWGRVSQTGRPQGDCRPEWRRKRGACKQHFHAKNGNGWGIAFFVNRRIHDGAAEDTTRTFGTRLARATSKASPPFSMKLMHHLEVGTLGHRLVWPLRVLIVAGFGPSGHPFVRVHHCRCFWIDGQQLPLQGWGQQ